MSDPIRLSDEDIKRMSKEWQSLLRQRDEVIAQNTADMVRNIAATHAPVDRSDVRDIIREMFRNGEFITFKMLAAILIVIVPVVGSSYVAYDGLKRMEETIKLHMEADSQRNKAQETRIQEQYKKILQAVCEYHNCKPL